MGCTCQCDKTRDLRAFYPSGWNMFCQTCFLVNRNIVFAIASLKEGFEVYVDGSLSNEPDRRLYNVTDIGDCDDHLFIIKKGEAA